MNAADRAETALAKRASKERWELAEFLQELRRQFPNTAPAPLPPEPTDEIPGTLEKCQVMEARVRQGYLACHPRDPRIVNGRVTQTTVNENGSVTEYEERDELEARQEQDRARNRRKGRGDCDPAMTDRLQRIDQLLARLRTRRRR